MDHEDDGPPQPTVGSPVRHSFGEGAARDPDRKGGCLSARGVLDADVRYVLWEYRGFGMKPDSDYERYMRINLPNARIRTFSRGARKAELILMLREALGQLLLDCQVVNDDGGIALIDLSKSRASME